MFKPVSLINSIVYVVCIDGLKKDRFGIMKNYMWNNYQKKFEVIEQFWSKIKLCFSIVEMKTLRNSCPLSKGSSDK